MSILGTRVIRTEDPRLLTVGGTYVDDLRVPELEGALEATFVRSPLAHALITDIDTSMARDEPGVVAVVTARDVGGPAAAENAAPQNAEAAEDELVAAADAAEAVEAGEAGEAGAETGEAGPGPLGHAFTEPMLAADRVRFVGEPVALVLTDGRYQGEDAAELVSVDYDPLPAVVGTAVSLAGQTLLFPPAHGQGHHTAWAMLVESELGIPMAQVEVIHGDTDLIPVGVGTFASRSLQIGGSAVHKAAAEVKDEARRLAAGMLEASEADLELDTGSGQWQVRGDPETGLSWAQIAAQADGDGLVASVEFKGDGATFPFGAHVAVVEVDVETGKVRHIRHVTVDDAGPVLNPVLAEGQRHGGIAQGAAQALLEEVRYDADGNPVTSNLADYAAITATELPSFELVAMETPTTLNPLGVKGIGEAGTIGATPAVQNAVIDAVAHLGVRHIDMPTTPERVWTAIGDAQKARNP